MANYTEHYQLHQWEPGDAFLRTDFNEDLEKIDTALGALSVDRIAQGSYVGDGTNDRIIQLPFAPEFVIILGYLHDSAAIEIITKTAYRSVDTDYCGDGSDYRILLEGNSIRIRHYNSDNQKGKTIHYIAIR